MFFRYNGLHIWSTVNELTLSLSVSSMVQLTQVGRAIQVRQTQMRTVHQVNKWQVFCIYNVQNFKILLTRPKVTHFFKINAHKHMRNVPKTPWYLEMFQVRQKTTKMSKDSELSKTRPIRSESRDDFPKIFYYQIYNRMCAV